MDDIKTKRVLVFGQQSLDEAKAHYERYGWSVLSETILTDKKDTQVVSEHYLGSDALSDRQLTAKDNVRIPCLSLVKENAQENPELDAIEAEFKTRTGEAETQLINAQLRRQGAQRLRTKSHGTNVILGSIAAFTLAFAIFCFIFGNSSSIVEGGRGIMIGLGTVNLIAGIGFLIYVLLNRPFEGSKIQTEDSVFAQNEQALKAIDVKAEALKAK